MKRWIIAVAFCGAYSIYAMDALIKDNLDKVHETINVQSTTLNKTLEKATSELLFFIKEHYTPFQFFKEAGSGFWPYAVGIPITLYSFYKLINTPIDKDHTTEALIAATYTFAGIGFMHLISVKK